MEEIQLSTLEVNQNHTASRFEIILGAQRAVLEYTEEDGTLTLLHVGVPYEFRGQGVAAIITQAGLDYARQKNLRVIPVCSYVQAYIRRHPEYEKLIR